MARVICKIKHAAGTINGVKFETDKGQHLSEEISDEQAAYFGSIPGYSIVGAKAKGKAAAAAAASGAAGTDEGDGSTTNTDGTDGAGSGTQE